VDVCYEIHPGEDLHDGDTFERFLKATGNHKRVNILYDPSHFVLQQLDYIAYIDHYHEFIKSFHVKDSEFNPTGKKVRLVDIMIGVIGQDGTVRWAMAR
jgi:sugar phosphate isomerase/epimerase